MATASEGLAISGDLGHVGGLPDLPDASFLPIRQSANSSRLVFRGATDAFAGRGLYAVSIAGLPMARDNVVYLPLAVR